MARAKGGQNGIPKYGEISIPIKNVSNLLQYKVLFNSFSSSSFFDDLSLKD